MYVCYLDDSYSAQSDLMTMAGYLASEQHWQAYEHHASEVYKLAGIGEVLHATNLQATKPPFKGWSRRRKVAFVNSLVSAKTGLTWGVARSVSRAGFQSLKTHPGIGPNMSPLGLAFASVLHAIVLGNPLSGLVQQRGVHFVVEGGNANDGDVRRYYNRVSNDPRFFGALRGLTFGTKMTAKALHLADVLAFYTRRQHALDQAAKRKLIIPVPEMLKPLYAVVPHMSGWSEMDSLRAAEAGEGDGAAWSMPLSMRSET